ncbi:MAG: condensation domain-containing protein, partial [Bacteroidota bacterium]
FSYEEIAGKRTQVYTDQGIELKTVDLRSLAADDFGLAVTKHCEHFQQSLDISIGQLSQFVWMQTPTTQSHNRLLMVIHHLAIDGVSWRILLEDIQNALQAAQKGEAFSWSPKSSSYRQWYQGLVAYAQENSVSHSLNHWITTVQGFQPLPLDLEEVQKTRLRAMAEVQQQLDKAATDELLQQVHQAYKTEINDILLAALALTIGEWTGRQQFNLGLEGHGRDVLEGNIPIDQTVGWFTTLYPVGLTYPETGELRDAIKATKEALRRIPDKGLSYGALRYLHKDAAIREQLSNDRPWDIVFNYLGQLDKAIAHQDRLIQGANESVGASVHQDNWANYKMAINCAVLDGELKITWTYSSAAYHPQTIQQLAQNYLHHLKQIIQHCKDQSKTELTPSDLGFDELVSYQELDAFLDTKDDVESDNDFLLV